MHTHKKKKKKTKNKTKQNKTKTKTKYSQRKAKVKSVYPTPKLKWHIVPNVSRNTIPEEGHKLGKT
jgi:hypothetical protein